MLSCSAASTLSARTACAQVVEPKSEAQRLAREGRNLSAKGQHDQAMQLLKHAYETYQDPGYLYNLGSEYQILGSEPEALDAFDRFLDDVEKMAPEFVAEANQHRRELRKRVGQLVITANGAGAHIFVDDREAGSTPLAAPIRVRTGSHTIVVRKDGFEPFETTVDVSPVTESRIEALMRPTPVPAVNSRGPMGAAGFADASPSATGGTARTTYDRAAASALHLSGSVGAVLWATGVDGGPTAEAARSRRRDILHRLAFSLGAGYRVVNLSTFAELRLGGKVGLTYLSEASSPSVFISVVANPVLRLALGPPRLFVFAELGLGALVISGVQQGSVLLESSAAGGTGPLATIQLRPALGVECA
jgi:hypothetical protein